MTDRNQFIAEKLEPEPEHMVPLWGPHRSRAELWLYERTGGDPDPANFDTDPAAMVALIEAITAMGYRVKIDSNSAAHRVEITHLEGLDIYAQATEENNLGLAVRDAAYKALGGKEES